MRVQKLLAVLGVVGGLGAITPHVLPAQTAQVYSDRLGYGGDAGSTVTRYNTLADAIAGTNPVLSEQFPQRDLLLQLYSGGHPGFDPYVNFQTWIFLGGTPSETEVGYIQFDDFDGSHITWDRGFWTNSQRTSFFYEAHGGNTDPTCITGDCGWIWSPGEPFGDDWAPADADTYLGSFLYYDLTMMVTGLESFWNPDLGWYESYSNPASVTGSISGLFQIDTSNPLYSAANGYYQFNLNMNLDNWWFDEFGEYSDANPLGSASYFAAVETVPEPATMTLMATGLAGLMASRRRKKA